MKKKLNIPYYSQISDVKDEYWRARACGALCLKSILNGRDNLSVDEFIKLGEGKGAYGESGWIHQGLVDIAKDFEMNLKREEFKEEGALEKGVEKIKNNLENNKPVLVSAIKRFKEKDKFHMIVLAGFEEEGEELKGFYYNDSDYGGREGEGLFVDIDTFKKYWRRLSIFVE